MLYASISFPFFRLLGPASAAEILQLTSTLSNAQSAGGSGPTRVVLAGDNFPVIQRGPDDDLFEELFQVLFL